MKSKLDRIIDFKAQTEIKKWTRIMATTYHMLLVALLGLIDVLNGYKYFQERIPNGDRLPHPCKPNFLWHGVGHKDVAGGGEKNPFGLDFASNGYKWDICLCQTDSDGDGKTNGEELGDPQCIWTEGSIPQVTDVTKLSHPGVCEPLDDPRCAEVNDWEFCSHEEFKCEAFDKPGVEKLTMRFPETNVPSSDTTYMCMAFPLPNDKDYHIIGSVPQIDNADVMHHTIVYGCEGDIANSLLEAYATPIPCDEMVQQACPAILTAWTLGLDGYCPNESFGFRIGATGYKVAIMEFHWNNPQLIEDYTDSSGMTIVYTPNLREYDANSLFVGPLNMEIPAGQNSHEEIGYCSSQCTSSKLNSTIYISEFTPHMHYLGRSMVVEQWRDGRLHLQIDILTYQYDSPEFIYYDPPIEFRPGDEIKVVCEFSSKNRDETTYFGPATSDEMCFAIMTYYPSNPSFSVCMANTRNGPEFCGAFDLEGLQCNYTQYYTEEFRHHMSRLSNVCDSTGKTCLPNCKAAIDEVTSSSVCYSYDMLPVTKTMLYQQESTRPMVHMLDSCREIVVTIPSGNSEEEYRDVEGSLCNAPTPSSASAIAHVNIGVVVAMFIAFL